jgi:hypothetical protein
MDLKRHLLEEESQVLVSFWLPEEDDPHDTENRLLVIRYHGTYGIGSDGNGDAVYMTAMGRAAIEVFEPATIVIDLSELHYEWGDMLECLWNLGFERQLPYAIVVGPGCRAAVGTLLFGIDSTTDACDSPEVFDTLDAAVAYVRSQSSPGESAAEE